MEKEAKKILITAVILSVVISSLVGGTMGFWAGSAVKSQGILGIIRQALTGKDNTKNDLAPGKVVKVDEESAIINAVEKVSPTVVSIIVSKDLPIIERYYTDPFGGDDFLRQFFGDDSGSFFGVPQYRQKGTQKQEVGGGTGFIVSADGYVVTNKHVVADEEAEYTILMNDEKKYAAKVLARDPVNDLAILKIEGKNFPAVELGDSSNLKVGQTVIAFGNALGEFRNTVSTGVISGLSRSVTAGGLGLGSEQLMGVIQTDASINPGNSGGPLANIAGQIIGINTAMAAGAENIGFAIPINTVKNTIDSVRKNGRIVRPWLGIRYVQIDKTIAEENKLAVDYGALIVRGSKPTDLAVIPASPADKAGLQENDIILELNGQKLDSKNQLSSLVGNLKIGDEVNLKVLHKGEQKNVKVKLEEMKS